MNIRTAAAGALIMLGMAVTAGVATLRASDPIGVYAVVQKVVLEPTDGAPQRIQVWGAFALADTTNADDYGSPQVGYVYYTCPQGQEQTCRNEWADIKSVAGTGTGIAFGGRRVPSGTIRKADAAPTAPDAYPIRMGVTKVGSTPYQAPIIARLKAALK